MQSVFPVYMYVVRFIEYEFIYKSLCDHYRLKKMLGGKDCNQVIDLVDVHMYSSANEETGK